MSEWRPAMSAPCYDRQPPVGALIGIDHKVWRVARIEPLNPGDWSERAREMWIAQGMADPWRSAPFRVLATKPDGGREHGMVLEPWHYMTWRILPEDYAVCARCGEPAPCREYEQRIQAEKEMAAAEKEMELPPGCCPACREPISTRQKTHRFPGPNLLNPLGAPDVEFHTRSQCRHGAAQYEKQWLTADPSRQPSMLTLKCTGVRISHADGSAECAGRDGVECPNIYAHHGSQSACWCATAGGCPRAECAGSRHGTRIAKGLRADGSRRDA